jgi:hypothetical protein
MSQAYNRPPSDIYEVKGAAGLFFDKGLYYFGRYVEGVVERAGQDALSPSFARSAQARAFARCMGDDMEKSTAGYADPFTTGAADAPIRVDENGDEIVSSGY